MERDTFCKLFFPGYGPIVDTVRTRSLNPVGWSSETKAGLAVQAGLVLTGCGKRVVEAPLPEYQPYWADYFPEAASWLIQESGTFNTGKSVTDWINFTDYRVSQAALKAMYSSFEQLSEQGSEIPYQVAGRQGSFYLVPRSVTERVVFFIPQDKPTPNWGQPDLVHGTTRIITSGFTVTFIRLAPPGERPANWPFTNTTWETQRRLRTEVCQSTMTVVSRDFPTGLGAQDLVCNGLGLGTAARDLDLPAEDYQAWAQKTVLTLSSDLALPLPVIPWYDQMEPLEPVVRVE